VQSEAQRRLGTAYQEFRLKLRQYPPLDVEVEYITARAAADGDAKAAETLFNHSLRLVVQFMGSYIERAAQRGLDPAELLSVGCLGLQRAVKNFDVTKGFRFSTFAKKHIEGEFKRLIEKTPFADAAPIDVPIPFRKMVHEEVLERRAREERSRARRSHPRQHVTTRKFTRPSDRDAYLRSKGLPA
jgi:DNA-directed RNA polymerase sigma subunit (sigma70/sigma32)